MGQVLHGCARTIEAVRVTIQRSEESVRALAARYGVIPTTVQKWRKRSHAHDAAMGPKEVRSSVLTLEAETAERVKAAVVAFRRRTLLPLDDCLYALQPSFPHLTRSSLHRCPQRHGIARLPGVAGDKPGRRKFKAYPIGFFHIEIAEVRTGDGKLYLFVAIDRTSKFVVARLAHMADRQSATAFLETVIKAVPHRIHTVLTDNGIQFCHPPRYRSGPTAKFSMDLFDRLCCQNGIEHWLTKPNNPWTNGQVERMNRTIKDATVKRYHYADHQQLQAHLELFLDAYNHARRFKALNGLTPHGYVCRIWTEQPERFSLTPYHHTPGLNV